MLLHIVQHGVKGFLETLQKIVYGLYSPLIPKSYLKRRQILKGNKNLPIRCKENLLLNIRRMKDEVGFIVSFVYHVRMFR